MQNELSNKSISPWLTMWYSPRKTIRQIVDTDPQKQILLLSALLGISWALNQLSSRNVGDKFSFISVLFAAIIGGSIIGVILVYLVGALLHWTGQKFGGKAPVEHLRAAYAWSWIPNIWMLFIWLLVLLILGTDMFTSATPKIEATPILALILIGFTVVNVITGLLSFIFIISCISEVQQFSNWRAFGSLMTSVLILLVPVFCLLAFLSGFYVAP
jgi:hypothetical protein